MNPNDFVEGLPPLIPYNKKKFSMNNTSSPKPILVEKKKPE